MTVSHKTYSLANNMYRRLRRIETKRNQRCHDWCGPGILKTVDEKLEVYLVLAVILGQEPRVGCAPQTAGHTVDKKL
jgi:hypothetical protein